VGSIGHLALFFARGGRFSTKLIFLLMLAVFQASGF